MVRQKVGSKVVYIEILNYKLTMHRQYTYNFSARLNFLGIVS